jgi:sarcosine oxidase
MWTEAVDGHWLVGQHPESPRLVIGAACNGRGFRYAPAIGEILADLTGGTARPDLEVFAPTRFTLTSTS